MRLAERSVRRGGGKATIADVARIAGVSAMTVSRVINDGGNVRPATRSKVADAIRALNYAPNHAARTLASAETMRIGLLYNNPSSSYLGELLIGALMQTGRLGSQLVLEQCGDEAGAAGAVRKLQRAGVDGILIPPPLCDSADLCALLDVADMPFVLIASGRPGAGRAAIRIDDHAAARQMTAHLIALGHRRIAFVRGHPNQTASAERERGYCSAMAAAALPIDPAWIEQGYFTYQSGVEAAARILALSDRPTAIFASNDDMAAGVSAMAHRLHLDVPRDLAVAGFDDTQLATAIFPELTTIRQPIAQMARRAVDLLCDRIRGVRADVPTPVAMESIGFELIERGSSVADRANA
jgi:LacI family transcriptional regulator